MKFIDTSALIEAEHDIHFHDHLRREKIAVPALLPLNSWWV